MAKRVNENSQPTSRPAGRNLNPLVANVFPPAFAIKLQEAARQSVARQLLSYSVCTEPGIEPGASRLGRALYHVVLRAFPPLQILSKIKHRSTRADKFLPRLYSLDVVPGGIRPLQILSKIKHRSTRADKFLPRLYSLDVVPGGIRPAKSFLPRPGHVRIDVTG